MQDVRQIVIPIALEAVKTFCKNNSKMSELNGV